MSSATDIFDDDVDVDASINVVTNVVTDDDEGYDEHLDEDVVSNDVNDDVIEDGDSMDAAPCDEDADKDEDEDVIEDTSSSSDDDEDEDDDDEDASSSSDDDEAHCARVLKSLPDVKAYNGPPRTVPRHGEVVGEAVGEAVGTPSAERSLSPGELFVSSYLLRATSSANAASALERAPMSSADMTRIASLMARTKAIVSGVRRVDPALATLTESGETRLCFVEQGDTTMLRCVNGSVGALLHTESAAVVRALYYLRHPRAFSRDCADAIIGDAAIIEKTHASPTAATLGRRFVDIVLNNKTAADPMPTLERFATLCERYVATC